LIIDVKNILYLPGHIATGNCSMLCQCSSSYRSLHTCTTCSYTNDLKIDLRPEIDLKKYDRMIVYIFFTTQ